MVLNPNCVGWQDMGHSNLPDYNVSQEKTSPTFLSITRESIVGFS